MTLTINQKFDLPESLYQEYGRYSELATQENRTTTGVENFTNTTTGVPYNSTTGEEGLLTLLETALSDYKINASEWNTFQTETDDALDDLIIATYSTTTDQSAVRSTALSGNVNGALTQLIEGESALNINGDEGGLYKDNDSDGIANALTSTTTTSETLLNQIQSFTATAQNGRLTFDSRTVTVSDVILVVMEDCTADSSSVILNVNSGATTVTDAHSGSGTEQLALLITANATTVTVDYRDTRAGAWTEVSFGKTRIINLTEEGDAGLSLANALLKYAKHFDNVGHATINSKITGTNGEFELKESYILPKDPDGTASEIITLDNQNFARMKHKLFILNGDLDWSSFVSNTNTYRIQISAFLTTNNLKVLTTDTGLAINNDGKLPINNDLDDDRHIYPQQTLFIFVEKALVNAMPSGGTLAGFKEYLNANPVHAFFRIDSSANYVDIPIKHLGSIEDGTIINNSIILPSAITYTYPTNEAAERESSQIAQNQITTAESEIVNQELNTVFTGSEVNTQGIYSNNIKTIFSDIIETFTSTAKITTIFEGGRINTTIVEV